MAKNRHGEILASFLPAVGPEALKHMQDKIRQVDLHRQTYLLLEEMARRLNTILGVGSSTTAGCTRSGGSDGSSAAFHP